MLAKIDEKNKAIELRKQGFSYSEILEKIPVAKSSLSLWLKNVGLAKAQKQRLSEKKRLSALKGAMRKKEIRIALTDKIKSEAKKEVSKLTNRELWLIGIALYWGEGNKEKPDYPGSPTQFSNSDPEMIRIFLRWLLNIVGIPKDDLYFQIYIHENCRYRANKVTDYWSKISGFSKHFFNHIYYKKNKIKTNRKNIGENYFGLLRIGVKNSSTLNRRIQGWVEGICKN